MSCVRLSLSLTPAYRITGQAEPAQRGGELPKEKRELDDVDHLRLIPYADKLKEGTQISMGKVVGLGVVVSHGGKERW
jgi:hypothetical protein